MTLDRIRELLDAIECGDGHALTAQCELLDAAVPLLLRWTDATPITPEALEAAGWKCFAKYTHGRKSWTQEFGLRSCRVTIYHHTGAIWFGVAGANHGTLQLHTMGQLHMIVDAISESKGETND